MPSIITHYLCGTKTWDLLGEWPLKDIISQNRLVFNLGTQGPDILFYHRVWPWAKKEGINKIGEIMHQDQVNAFFSHAIEYIIKQDLKERNMLTAYLSGYICHYALDFHTHAYIFYKTGFIRSGDPATSKYTYYHRVFETVLDVVMLKLTLEKKPIDINIPRLLQVTPDNALSIGRLYQSALNGCNQKITADQVAEGIKDMVSVQNILRDRLGIKKALLSCLERTLGNYPLMASMIYPTKIRDKLDYLNEKKNTWYLPWDPTLCSTLSFPEMFHQAAAAAKEMAEIIYCCITGNVDKETALGILGNRSFSTGLDCRENPDFIAFNCIFEENPQKNTNLKIFR
ncbi:MAG: zinc dependent phospholipase C family protein [Dehalobacterium sp.]